MYGIVSEMDYLPARSCKVIQRFNGYKFAGSWMRGCFFHFTQSVWRKVQNLGLAVTYRESPEVRTLVRRLAVLPLVPKEDLDDAWMLIHASAPSDVAGIRVSGLLDYMVQTWMDDRAPLFHRDMWNHYDNMDVGDVRTNNHLESFHSALAKDFSAPHPNIYALISALQRKQQETENSILQLTLGNPPPQKKRGNRVKEIRIQRVREQFQNGQRYLMNYVDALGFTIKLQ